MSTSTHQISIVTICFNNLDELISTCQSVSEQETLPYEHLIIDGSSNQEIKNWLESQPQPNYRRWICERDNGIADAFNKGVTNSKGNIINFLNSGDFFHNKGNLSEVLKAFDDNPNITWLHGAYIFYRGGIWLEAGTPFDLKQNYKGMRQVSHQSMYVKKSLFDKHGLFDLNKKVGMDYDFLVRIRNEEFLYLTSPLCKFAPDGVSYQNIWAGLQEVGKSYDKYVGFSIKQRLWTVRSYLLFMFTQRTKLGSWLFQMKNRAKKIK